MSAQRPEARAQAPANTPRLLGVPVPSQAFGFAPGWCRSAVEAEASASASLVDDLAFVRQWKRIHREADNPTRPVWSLDRYRTKSSAVMGNAQMPRKTIESEVAAA